MVGPEVIEEVMGMIDLIVSQVLNGGRTVDDAGGNAVVGICIS